MFCSVNEAYKSICNPVYDGLFKYFSQRYLGTEDRWLLIKAIAWIESRYKPDAVGKANEIGLCQILPSTGALFDYTIEMLYDPTNNIECSSRYLGDLFSRFGTDVKKVVCGYNCGGGRVSGCVASRGIEWFNCIPDSTQRYYRLWLSAFEDLSRCPL